MADEKPQASDKPIPSEADLLKNAEIDAAFKNFLGATELPALAPSRVCRPSTPRRYLPTHHDPTFAHFSGEMKGVDRDNEVERILRAFKLNPFEQLGVRFDASAEDIKKKYRQSSLMVHPDKCKHEHAKAAFEVLGYAHKILTGTVLYSELPRPPAPRRAPCPRPLTARPCASPPSPLLHAGADEDHKAKLDDLKPVLDYALEELRKEVRKERR